MNEHQPKYTYLKPHCGRILTKLIIGKPISRKAILGTIRFKLQKQRNKQTKKTTTFSLERNWVAWENELKEPEYHLMDILELGDLQNF